MTDTHDALPVVFDNRDIAGYAPGERRMAMRGFEDEYTDIVDWIIRITHRIWEEKEVGYIYDTYQHNCIVHGSMGDAHGRDGVVASTLQALAAFSGYTYYGHDVIWTGDEEHGFHTSHHSAGTGVHTGDSVYGPPTGRRFVARAIANCVARDNRIFEEWVLHDDPAMLRQLGYEPYAVAEGQVRAANPFEYAVATSDPERLVGQNAPAPYPQSRGDHFDVADFVRSTYHEVWNRRLLNQIGRRYDRSHVCVTTGERRFHGPSELTGFVLQMLAMFPDAGVTVDDVYWNGDDAQGYHVAVRWTLAGTHLGYGVYGPPSGARVRAMCLSQHVITNGRFVQESSIFDEMALLRQIAAQRLAST
jgi:predicted ester cyclase